MKPVARALTVAALGAVAFAFSAYALDPPHNYSANLISCTDGSGGQRGCHNVHDAPGGAITKIAGNANLCISCHNVGGIASNKPFADGDQALPAPGLPGGVSATGTAHRWDSGAAGHVEAVGTLASTGTVQSGGAFTGRFAKTYTITTNDPPTTFSWSCVRWPGDTICGSGSGNTTGTTLLNEGVNVIFDGSFVASDQWRIFVRTDISHPTNAALRTSDGKIMCSSCHNQHSQAAQPFDPSAPGSGAGRHFQRIDNGANEMCLDCHAARNKGSLSGQTGNMTHPIGLARSVWNGLFKARASITLPLDKGADGVAGNTDDRIQCLSCHAPHYAPTSDGSLSRITNITTLCTDCHTLADPGTASHLNTSTGVLWPGGQYGSNFPEITDTSKRGACINCHSPHGWPDDVIPSQDHAKLLVEQATGDICFTCHDSDGPATVNIYTQFSGATDYRATALDGALVNQRHDVTAADQAYSGGVVACANCHNPHAVTNTAKVMDPDNPSVVFNQTYAKTNSYTRSGYNFSYQSAGTDLDPINPQSCKTSTTAKWGIEWPAIPTIPPLNTGDDTAVSGGTYNDNGDPLAITYTVTVTTGGAFGTARITVTSTGNRDNSGPTTVTANHTAVAVGTRGVTITFHDPASMGGGLTANDKWFITVSPCATAAVLDTVTFCLVCHDNSPPAGVTMSPNLVNLASAYRDADQHGRIVGNDGGNGEMKAPWNDSNADTETAFPYASLPCALCHDGHGSDNIFHLKKSVTVRGIQMRVGGGVGSGFEPPAFSKWGSTTYTLPCFNAKGTLVACGTAGSSQQDHKWAAWCTFCHTLRTHGQSEDATCRTGHRHGGGAF